MIESYLTDSVVIVRTTKDKWGEVSATALATHAARVEWQSKMVLDRAGQEVVAAGRILVANDADILHSDLLRVEGDDHGIIQIRIAKDFAARLKEVWIK